MKKGKFGIVLCFYPIAAFAAVILNSPLICLAITMAAIFLEKDEWTGRQTLQACMASAVVFFFDQVLGLVKLVHIPYISTLLSVVATIAFVLVYLAAIVFSVLAIIRVRKDGEANFPLFCELAYHIYGKCRPKPVAPAAPPVQQYPIPYGAPQQPVQPTQQPYQPQNPYQAPPAQYVPPMAVQPPQEPQTPQPPQGPGPSGSAV